MTRGMGTQPPALAGLEEGSRIYPALPPSYLAHWFEVSSRENLRGSPLIPAPRCGRDSTRQMGARLEAWVHPRDRSQLPAQG